MVLGQIDWILLSFNRGYYGLAINSIHIEDLEEFSQLRVLAIIHYWDASVMEMIEDFLGNHSCEGIFIEP